MLHRIDGTWYGNEEGTKRYLRVSRALESINKPALMHWAARAEREYVVEAAATLHSLLPSLRLSKTAYKERLQAHLGKAKAFSRESRRALDIGSQVHSMVEYTLRQELGHKVTKKPELVGPALLAFQRWEKWREDTHLTPIHIEQTIWSDSDEYAGTPDLIAQIDVGNGPELVVLDWKTSKGFYLEMKLQNAAYAKAYCEMGHAEYPMPGLLVRLPKSEEDQIETLHIEKESQESLYEGFRSALSLAKFLLSQGNA